MIENSSQDKHQERRKREVAHINLSYSYVDDFLKTKSKSIDDLNNRLTVVLGFSGLLLRFCLELYGCDGWTLSLRILAVIATTCAAAISAYGLCARKTGKAFRPDKLASKEFSNAQEPALKAEIIKKWVQGIALYEKSEEEKLGQLNDSITSILIAIILIACNIIVGSRF